MNQESAPPKRAASFQAALTAIRAELRAGLHAPGARLTAADIGPRLKLSATPVREALSHLAGEGVLDDRRGLGFFVQQLSAADVGDLFRLQLQLLLIAVRTEPAGMSGAASAALKVSAGLLKDDDVVALGDHLLRWAASSGSRVLLRNLRRLQDQLAPVRRVEPLLLPDLDTEAAALAVALESDRREGLEAALRRFHQRRIDLAAQLALLAESSTNIDSI